MVGKRRTDTAEVMVYHQIKDVQMNYLIFFPLPILISLEGAKYAFKFIPKARDLKYIPEDEAV